MTERGETCTKVNINTPDQEFRKVNAVIIDGVATILNKRGDILASMSDAQVAQHAGRNAVWSNETEVWTIDGGCGCGSAGCV